METIKRPRHRVKYLDKDTKSKKHNPQKMGNTGSIRIRTVTIEEICYLKMNFFFDRSWKLERVYNLKLAIDLHHFHWFLTLTLVVLVKSIEIIFLFISKSTAKIRANNENSKKKVLVGKSSYKSDVHFNIVCYGNENSD